MIYNNYVAIHGKNALKGLSRIFFFKWGVKVLNIDIDINNIDCLKLSMFGYAYLIHKNVWVDFSPYIYRPTFCVAVSWIMLETRLTSCELHLINWSQAIIPTWWMTKLL